MMESWGYFCLVREIRFRQSAFPEAQKKGLIPSGHSIWYAGYFIYTKKRFGYGEINVQITNKTLEDHLEFSVPR